MKSFLKPDQEYKKRVEFWYNVNDKIFRLVNWVLSLTVLIYITEKTHDYACISLVIICIVCIWMLIANAVVYPLRNIKFIKKYNNIYFNGMFNVVVIVLSAIILSLLTGAVFMIVGELMMSFSVLH